MIIHIWRLVWSLRFVSRVCQRAHCASQGPPVQLEGLLWLLEALLYQLPYVLWPPEPARGTAMSASWPPVIARNSPGGPEGSCRDLRGPRNGWLSPCKVWIEHRRHKWAHFRLEWVHVVLFIYLFIYLCIYLDVQWHPRRVLWLFLSRWLEGLWQDWPIWGPLSPK